MKGPLSAHGNQPVTAMRATGVPAPPWHRMQPAGDRVVDMSLQAWGYLTASAESAANISTTAGQPLVLPAHQEDSHDVVRACVVVSEGSATFSWPRTAAAAAPRRASPSTTFPAH